ncbi:hypothetical protein TGMAS_230500 [Toxoplasma gondii MAS]|uniref:Uncharacterized protein n=1 Tax=Toxoplasma gondii MAS TaxID=943118 RepID=A0A086QY17_TOXGO|nr:hypothetical protein TGMAS_230500 [Toxoplasma gondii MAS]
MHFSPACQHRMTGCRTQDGTDVHSSKPPLLMPLKRKHGDGTPANSASRSGAMFPENMSDSMRPRGDDREANARARGSFSRQRQRKVCDVSSLSLYARVTPEFVPDEFSSLSSSGQEDGDEELSDESPHCGDSCKDEPSEKDGDDDVDSQEDSDAEPPAGGGSCPHQYSSPKLPSFPRTLRRLLHALAKRLLQQPDLRAFTEDLAPLSTLSKDARRDATDESPGRNLPTVGCSYIEAVRLVALLLKDVGPGGCVSPQLFELVDECVARAGASCLKAIPEKPTPRLRKERAGTPPHEKPLPAAAAKAAAAVRKMENVQWQLWRDTANCTSTMRGQICCQSIDRLLTSQQIQAAVWEGSSKIAAWRLGASDCLAAAALATAKGLLSLQLAVRSLQKNSKQLHSDDDLSEDDAETGRERNGELAERGPGRRSDRQEEHKLWEKALAKVPREIRAEVESALLFCLRKKKMPPILLLQLFVALNRRSNLSSCLALASNFCRLYPYAPFFRDVHVELLLLKLGSNEKRKEDNREQDTAQGQGDRLDTVFSCLFRLIDEEQTEFQRTRKALSTASRQFVKVHCGGEEALQRLSEFWDCLKKRDRLDCLLLALEVRPACASTWWRLANFLTSDREPRELLKMRCRLQALSGAGRTSEISKKNAAEQRTRMARFTRRFFVYDSCSLTAVPETGRVALFFCAPFFLDYLQLLLEFASLLGAAFPQTRPQLLTSVGKRLLQESRGSDPHGFFSSERSKSTTRTVSSTLLQGGLLVSLGDCQCLKWDSESCESVLRAFEISTVVKTRARQAVCGFADAVLCFYRVPPHKVFDFKVLTQLAVESVNT